MARNKLFWTAMIALLGVSAALPAGAQSFRVQCPNGTVLHHSSDVNNPYERIVSTVDNNHQIVNTIVGPDAAHANKQIKCQQISGGDGYATMADGQQVYLFAFGPLSGIQNITAGLPGTVPAAEFNGWLNGAAAPFSGPTFAGDRSVANNAGIKEPELIMNNGVLAGNAPGPMMAIDEDDEFFLTLSNVGMIMRPDLFEQHTVHFHGYPNASSYFDGVPDASVAINIAGSFTYYYTAPDAGTYFWHCHITPPEHLQMGMEGQLYVRPRQNRLAQGASLYGALAAYTASPAGSQPVGYPDVSFPPEDCTKDLLCTTPLPPSNTATRLETAATVLYAYNDGDGSTRYDAGADYPIQMMGFDPNFHFIGMTFNPEPFADMKDKYFLLSGRGYPDTIGGDHGVPGPVTTVDSDGLRRLSQPQPTLIQIHKGGPTQRALLRISNLSVTEYHTLATVGIPMTVIAFHARLLRDMSGNNLYYNTNSITIGGGESLDVILDATNVPAGTYFLYTTNLDHLSNDAENFGGMMTEIQVL